MNFPATFNFDGPGTSRFILKIFSHPQECGEQNANFSIYLGHDLSSKLTTTYLLEHYHPSAAQIF